MGTFSFRQQAAFTFLLFGLLLCLVPRAGHEGDMTFWLNWSTYIFEHRLGDVYQLPDNNYNPLYHYFLWLYGQLMGNPEKIKYFIHWLKAGTLLFDFGGAFLAASLVPERARRFGLALLLLFNIGYLANTLLWVQVDSIYTFFAFAAVVLALRQRPVGSMLCFVLALTAKTQAIIFLPPLLLLWVPQWWHRPAKLLQAGVAGAGLLVLVLAPFIWWSWENYLPRIIEINSGATEVYPQVSMHAYNFWYLLPLDKLPSDIPDMQLLGGLPYRKWGLLLFCAFSALALAPLLALAVRALRGRVAVGSSGPPVAPLVLLSCGLIPLLFSYFNTQMHERYWHAAILFLAAYGFLRRDYWPYVLASVAYFLNLEDVLHYLQLLNYDVLVFQPWFIATLFSLTITLGLVKLYRLASWRAGQPSSAAAVTPAFAGQ